MYGGSDCTVTSASSLHTFRKRVKLHLFRLSYLALSYKLLVYCVVLVVARSSLLLRPP